MEETEPTATRPLDELYASLAALAYMMAGTRTHARLTMEAGITVDRAALALLRTLAAAPAPMRLGELADALRVKAPHVTRQVTLLEKGGLVETAKESTDQRVRRVAATEAGQETVARTEATSKQWLAQALHDYSEDDLATAASVLTRVVEAYQ
jgi:DNA-binding MarR family transcriptional regulator